MHDEWCLIARFDGADAEIASVVDQVRAELGDRLTRSGHELRVYSDSEEAAAGAEEIVISIIDATALGYELWQERWNAERGEWEELAPDEGAEDGSAGAHAEPGGDADASSFEAGEQGGTDAEPQVAELPAEHWEVVLHLEDAADAESLEARLLDRGLEAHRRRKEVTISAAGEVEAAELADHVRLEAPTGTRVETRRASHWRGLL